MWLIVLRSSQLFYSPKKSRKHEFYLYKFKNPCYDTYRYDIKEMATIHPEIVYQMKTGLSICSAKYNNARREILWKSLSFSKMMKINSSL